MGEQAHIAVWHGAAQQHVSFRFVLGKIQIRMVVFDRAFQQSRGARQASALATHRGKVDAVCRGGIQNMFPPAAIERAEAVGGFEDNAKAPAAAVRLWILRFAQNDAPTLIPI